MMIRYGEGGSKLNEVAINFEYVKLQKFIYDWTLVNWLTDMPSWFIIFKDSVFYITDLFLLLVIKKDKLKSLLFKK